MIPALEEVDTATLTQAGPYKVDPEEFPGYTIMSPLWPSRGIQLASLRAQPGNVQGIITNYTLFREPMKINRALGRTTLKLSTTHEQTVSDTEINKCMSDRGCGADSECEKNSVIYLLCKQKKVLQGLTPLILALERQRKGESLCLWSAWSTYQVSDLPRLNSEILSQKQNNNKQQKQKTRAHIK